MDFLLLCFDAVWLLFFSLKLFIIYNSTILFVLFDLFEVSDGALFSNRSLNNEAFEDALDRKLSFSLRLSGEIGRENTSSFVLYILFGVLFIFENLNFGDSCNFRCFAILSASRLIFVLCAFDIDSESKPIPSPLTCYDNTDFLPFGLWFLLKLMDLIF